MLASAQWPLISSYMRFEIPDSLTSIPMLTNIRMVMKQWRNYHLKGEVWRKLLQLPPSQIANGLVHLQGRRTLKLPNPWT
jgi:hypothetical protein